MAAASGALSELLVGEVAGTLLVFARVGGALMVVPGLGEHYVPPRVRLGIALALSLLVTPAVARVLPAVPLEPLRLTALVVPEIVLGVLMGLCARLALAAIHVGGSVIATQSGLSAAALFDPNEATPGTLPGTFLSVAALAFLFAADLHHLLIRAVAASYAIFPLGLDFRPERAAELLVALSAATLSTGLKIAAPLVVAGILVNLGTGALGRLVPSLPALFVALPLQLLLAFALLALSLPAALELFRGELLDAVGWLDRSG
jgi:flagellar biosynthetic protein FliR